AGRGIRRQGYPWQRGAAKVRPVSGNHSGGLEPHPRNNTVVSVGEYGAGRPITRPECGGYTMPLSRDDKQRLQEHIWKRLRELRRRKSTGDGDRSLSQSERNDQHNSTRSVLNLKFQVG